jgi:ABC-type antimicrobial peptide transport system permease subunit
VANEIPADLQAALGDRYQLRRVLGRGGMATVYLAYDGKHRRSEIGFGFALSPGVITRALIFALVMGLVGGFLPAVRAARLNIVNALRAS